ncbi:MAG: M48 family metallopeptidase [Firmicutes bacterium]|nr:M48 family metallopeptidase [Bacillota bacterium]
MNDEKNTTDLSYQLIRSKRKTIALEIKKASLVVKAPLSMQQSVIDKFIHTKKKWVFSKLESQEKKFEKFKEVLHLEKFLLHGSETEELQPNLFVPRIKRFYQKIAKNYLVARIDEISDLLGNEYKQYVFALSNAKTRWGSCNKNKKICLNWRLVLLDKALQDYVIIHELCHLKHLNHSKEFWNLIGRYCPNYKKLKLHLKENSALMEYLR